MTEAKIQQIINLLQSAYGTPRWRPDRDPLSELVRTILSQNTSDANSLPAFYRLKEAFPTWNDVAKAGEDEIAAIIKSSGMNKIKARRIKQALAGIVQDHGTLSLDFLDKLPVDEARDWLKQLPGVGDKTAACVLLFALGKPVLPVDTHIYRVSSRLGLLDGGISLSEAHQVLGRLVSGDDVYAFHVLMIEHGRRTCTARRPHCPDCALRMICPGYEKFMGRPASQ